MAVSAQGHDVVGQAPGDALTPVVRLWILRILVRLRAERRLLRDETYRDEALAEALGLPGTRTFDDELIPDDDADTDGDEEYVSLEWRVRCALREQLRQAEAEADRTPLPPCLRQNLTRLAALAGLSRAESQVLGFAILLRTDLHLDTACDLLGRLSNDDAIRVLSVVLGLSRADVRRALSPAGALHRSGLVRLDVTVPTTLTHKLDLLSGQLVEMARTPMHRPEDFLRGLLQSTAPPELTRAHYCHVEPELAVLHAYLASALDDQRRGANVLLHGPPGTGKTQLSRVLGAELRCAVYEVPVESGSGRPIDGGRRCRAFVAAQRLLSGRRALLVVDEMEDIADDDGSVALDEDLPQPLAALTAASALHGARKGWLNRILETNPVPTLWISNAVEHLHPAVVRRFDLVVHLPVPPVRERERLIRAAAPAWLPAQTVHRLAQCDALTPAVAMRAMRVVDTVAQALPEARRGAAVETLVDATLRAQGHPGLAHHAALAAPAGYDPALVNTTEDLERLVSGLARVHEGRLCLYGPPGTGKSAFARHLAERLGMPLLLRRASDLVSPLVGVTERHIAETFARAEREQALLLIDEAETFLRDRRGAERPWEVSEVNEMLTQMETFSGVLVAATNRMATLDQAALRRFDVKLHFDHLRPEQALALFRRTCGDLGLGSPEPEIEARLAHLSCLTPGDFAAVVRHHRLQPMADPGALLVALETECALKEEPRKVPIGFVR